MKLAVPSALSLLLVICNAAWALTFWPSTQALVQNYVALAPDFTGTVVNAIGNGGGGQALVKTTAIFTRTDEVVQPEVGPKISSDLEGATVTPLQDNDVCGYALMPSDETDADAAALINTVTADLNDIGAILVAGKTPAEPDLQPYVCARGFATKCGAAFTASSVLQQIQTMDSAWAGMKAVRAVQNITAQVSSK
ncbi:hypothetical protein RQP46_011172 [Phenoliferia psychrophenolica]